MRWDRDHESQNLEDRRGQTPPMLGGGAGSANLLWFVASRFGWKGIVVLLIGVAVVRGISAFTADDPQRANSGSQGAATASSDEHVRFVGFVFDDAQSFWERTFRAATQLYTPARIVVFSDAVESACGNASSAVGPFYCPRDERVFIDLGFYNELRDRFGAPGDFAQAYVLAHEMGHHVQHLTGRLDVSGDSVRTELQADCLAGVWAKDAERRNLLEVGDIDDAMRAAAAIGDDHLIPALMQKPRQRPAGKIRPADDQDFHGSTSPELLAAYHSGLRP